jgi:acyl-CoA synthetase (AMP-forming)/AMP-acid ligase II
MNPYDFFAAAAVLHPRRIAAQDDDSVVTYAQLKARVEQAARVLDTLYRGTQLRIAVFSPNGVPALAAMLAVFRTGAVWVPINARNALDENLLILRRSDVDVLLVHSKFAEHVARVQAEVPGLRQVFCIDRALDAAPSLDATAWQLAADVVARPRREDAQALCAMLSTGGTTGLPKAVMWSESVVEAMVASFWVHLPSSDLPVYLAAAPLTHAAGVIGLCLMARGATVVIHRSPRPREIMRAIARHGVTHLFLPPTAIYAMLSDADVRAHDYGSLRYFIYTAAPMAPEKIRASMDIFGPVMTQVYGQAEVPLMGTCFSPQAHAQFLAEGRLDKFTSCGQPTLLAQVEVMDEAGGLLAAGETGEIVFRGPLVMRGYYQSPQETAAVSAHGWHHTGDVGYKDADGYLHIVDRKKDMIITGGFNVFSTEVEQAILAYPGVQDCAVVGVPDEKWGEAVTAFVEVQSGVALEVEALGAHCRARLGGVKAPKAIHLVDSLPRSPVGKVLKREIRERFWAGKTRRV